MANDDIENPKAILSDAKAQEVMASLLLIVLARMDEEFEDAGPDFELLRTFLVGWTAYKRRHAPKTTT